MNMKTVFTTLFLVINVLATFGQMNSDITEHMTFKGVPIDGTLDEYILKMKKSGFLHIGTENKTAIFKGDFAAYKDCIIGVSTLKQKDLVSRITVLFPEQETWSSLSYNYFSLKELLTEKYGEPSESLEEFDDGQPSDDNLRMFKVKFDNCKYHTNYETNNGSIELSIDHDEISNCFVRLSYFDKINSAIIRAEAIDDL